MNANSSTYRLIIFVSALLLFIPFLGAGHLFDWDEINFAECAREMIASGDYSTVRINFEPFWEKPPLFFWFQVLSMKIFGVNEFAARFPNALAGAFTLLLLFNAGSRLNGRAFGFWWAFLYAASLLPHFYFKSGIIDPWFNLFIFAGVWFFHKADTASGRNNFTPLLFSGIFLGLATLTKGPVALLIFGLTFFIVWIIRRFSFNISFLQIVFFGLIALLTSASWFGIEALRGNSYVIGDFIDYQIRLFQTRDAGHGGPFFYHFVVLFLGCFPASVPAIAGMKRNTGDARQVKVFHQWMLVLFWVVLILFSIVKTKIVHYSSLAYFPLTFLATYFLYKCFYGSGYPWKSWMSVLFFISGIGFALALILLPVAGMNTAHLADPTLIKDPFVIEALQADAGWQWIHILPGVILFLTICWTTFYLLRKNSQMAFLITGLVTMAVLIVSTVLFVPRVERFSQGAAIDFYKALQGREKVLAHPVGFKSYAHLYYAERPAPPAGQSYPADPVAEPGDYTVFAVSKIQDSLRIRAELPVLKPLYSKHGFVFWIRENPDAGQL